MTEIVIKITDVSNYHTYNSIHHFNVSRSHSQETFSNSRRKFDPVKFNGQDLECLKYAKIFGLQISSDLTWNNHISEIVKKVNKRLYFLRQLKRSHVKSEKTSAFLLDMYKTCY